LIKENNSVDMDWKLFFYLLSILLPVGATAQDSPERLVKVGGFIYVDKGEYNGFSVHMELERAFKRRQYLTSGPRLDYVKIPDFGTIGENLFIGYHIKVYPFYFKHHVPFKGLFVGLEPLMLININEVDRNGNDLGRYGPGLGSLLGYQFTLRDKVSIGFEGCMNYVQNLNDNTNRFQGYNHESGRYIYFYANVKIGKKF
jgi:hypothetical protein